MRNLGIFIFILTLFGSCNSSENKSNSSIASLQTKKELLQKQMDSLATELKLIEDQLNLKSDVETNQIVTVVNATIGNFEHFIEVYGNVKADKNVEIHPELGGTVTQIFVKDGQQVSKGQTLLQLDASSINAAIEELKTRLELATTSFERQDRLWKQQIGSEMQYLQVKNQKESIEKSIKSLQIQANKMRITAPFDGVIDYIFPKIGELTIPQYPVIRLVNLKSLYVEADVTEAHLTKIKKGTPVQIVFPSINKELKATITNVGNFINPENRSFKIRIDIPNSESYLKPNLFGNINIKDFSASGIILPLQLIQQDKEGNHYVYIVVTENNQTKVVKKQITMLSSYKNQVLVGVGIQENDRIIDKGYRSVNAGNLVTIKSE